MLNYIILIYFAMHEGEQTTAPNPIASTTTGYDPIESVISCKNLSNVIIPLLLGTCPPYRMNQMRRGEKPTTPFKPTRSQPWHRHLILEN